MNTATHVSPQPPVPRPAGVATAANRTVAVSLNEGFFARRNAFDWAFAALVFLLGCAMGLGQAAVFKHIPVYYPQNVGAVGGMVGTIGGLGGFVLPIAFGWLKDATGLWSSCFMVLFLIVAACFAWMHLTVRRLDRTPAGQPA